MSYQRVQLLKTLICRYIFNRPCAAFSYPRTMHRTYSLYAKEPYQSKYVPISEQSILLEGKERARASKLADDPHVFVDTIPGAPNIKTVFDVLEYGMKISNDGDCIGTKSSKTGQYEWLKYSEVILRSQYVGSGLLKLGLKPCNDTFLGVFACNREEFLLSLYGCAAYSMVLIPLYISLGAQAVMFILKQASLSLVIVNDKKNALNVIKNASEVPSLRTMVLMDKPDDEVLHAAKGANIVLLHYSEMEELGRKNKKDLVLPNPEDLFCIPYTSGTTGIPKGVMLTHKNLITCCSSLIYGYGKAGIFGGTIISYLPSAHIYEICNEVASMYFARRIAFYSGDIKKLMDEVRFLKPTILPLVPRLMNAMYTNVMDSVKSSVLKALLLKIALARKEKLLKKQIITKKSIWDKLVFKKFQDILGGEVHMIVTTSAPVSQDVMRFFRCASGCYILEAYGQTEVLAGTMTLPYEYVGGHVGAPLPCNHMKLADVPEMGYFSKDDTGEICFKGANVYKGYFKNPEATKECLDDGGWHHSGDIGRWLPNGTLKVIDRKKHLFKLSQDYVVALIVPEFNNFNKWLKSKGFQNGNFNELLQNKEMRRAFLLELHKHGQREGLNTLEQAKNIAFLTENFSTENELMTPTLKLRRNNIRKMFQPLIEKLYEEKPLVKSSRS
ncbi:long-chain-fatty-acid--CoA ligase 1-like isoform X2 [Stegodyphus dumicola]|uniref:long-chain-fatty-acid--CoA ligase 1-like isoform X2 n=1 Tax=Stegodyphus dumicola TaxID=202533 RepID=UPI0015AA750C|nr:long-chain-fatty-acid--CoA ligase 1-like isoform X2 [Stegodyphus dumicola]